MPPVSLEQICALNNLQQTVNFGDGTSKGKKGQQQMSGPHGFQLNCSQCDILYDTQCSLLKDVLGREREHYLFLLCQVMNNQGGN